MLLCWGLLFLSYLMGFLISFNFSEKSGPGKFNLLTPNLKDEITKKIKRYIERFHFSCKSLLFDFFLSGYSGPLKEIPHEKFNTTIIPKSYSSPWSQALGDNTELLNALNTQLPQLPQRLQPSNYRCFNR